jgi:hypothetical protein
MAGTLNRLRFYMWCDLSSAECDYIPPIQDYPEYPRQEGVTFFFDRYKSALGSNYWTYIRGTSAYWNMDWIEVSDDCVATMGFITASVYGLSPHIAIYEGRGIDGITLGSLFTITGSTIKGTYFCENETWEPEEIRFGLWNFKTLWRKEG